MMVTALAFALAAANPPPVQVQGECRCPTAAEVATVLSELLPPAETSYPDVAWVEAAGLDLQIELRSPTGDVQSSRRITSSGSCADLAVIAAVVTHRGRPNEIPASRFCSLAYSQLPQLPSPLRHLPALPRRRPRLETPPSHYPRPRKKGGNMTCPWGSAAR
jgi:hypothetical protein